MERNPTQSNHTNKARTTISNHANKNEKTIYKFMNNEIS